DLWRRGKTVFMEKPMATTVERAEAILRAQREGGGQLMVGYMKRYDSGNQVAREAVRAFCASREMGAITYARNHGFCGDWIAGLDTPLIKSSEPMPPSPVVVPEW